MGRWEGKTTVRDKEAKDGLRVAETEIDLLAISRDAKEYLVGEFKFKKTVFLYSDYLDTIAKLTPLKQKSKFYYAFFSESRFDDKVENAAKENDICLYTLEDITKTP